MSLDKLVDSTQLDADLTSVANAIRTKGGTSAQLAFPSEFVSAIAAIPSVGTSAEDAILDGSLSGVYTNNNVVVLRDHALSNCKSVTGIIMPNVISTGQNAFYNCDHVTSISLPSLRSSGVYALAGVKALTAIALPALTGGTPNFFMSGDTALASTDFGPSVNGLSGQAFGSCSALRTVVLRRSSAIVTCSTNTFNGTPFASGGSGGTIYIPKSLYDHLGDGTSLDYKAATNWSTINGYGTITWAKIEGSQYENYYADGTPIT